MPCPISCYLNHLRLIFSLLPSIVRHSSITPKDSVITMPIPINISSMLIVSPLTEQGQAVQSTQIIHGNLTEDFSFLNFVLALLNYLIVLPAPDSCTVTFQVLPSPAPS